MLEARPSPEPGAPGARVRSLLRTLSESGSAPGALEARQAQELLPLVYDELKRVARAQMAGERIGHTLQATALVHEAWLRLCAGASPEPSWRDRAHFLAAAALAMRRILVERARARLGPRRGGGRARVELGESAVLAAEPEQALELLDLDEALERLAAREPRPARVVHLRYFAGLSLEETAAALELSPATVKADWSYARAWLHRELERGGEA